MPTFPARNSFFGEVTFNDRVTINQESSGSRQALLLNGAAPVSQLFEARDVGTSPIGSINTDGASYAAYGDRLAAYIGSDINNYAFATLTKSADNVSTNAGGIHVGHGTGAVKIFTGTGAPSSSFPVTSGMPANGSIYIRLDGSSATPAIYQARGGVWDAIAGLLPTTAAPKVGSGSWLVPSAATATNPFSTLGRVYLAPVTVARAQSFSALGASLTVLAAGGTSPAVRLGIYADDGNGRPTGAPLYDGSFDPTTTLGDRTVSIGPVTLPVGQLWVAWMCVSGSALSTSPTAVTVSPATSDVPDLGNNSYRSWRYDTTSNAGALPTLGTLTRQSVTPMVGIRAA